MQIRVSRFCVSGQCVKVNIYTYQIRVRLRQLGQAGLLGQLGHWVNEKTPPITGGVRSGFKIERLGGRLWLIWP